MQPTIFSHYQGSGYICHTPVEILQFIDIIPVTINNIEICPNDMTDLSGHFCKPITYLGLLKNSKNEMIFEIGCVKDLFTATYYYQSVFKIAEKRIFEMFSPAAGRDFIFKAGKWK